jgi:hypothetical protein
MSASLPAYYISVCMQYISVCIRNAQVSAMHRGLPALLACLLASRLALEAAAVSQAEALAELAAALDPISGLSWPTSSSDVCAGHQFPGVKCQGGTVSSMWVTSMLGSGRCGMQGSGMVLPPHDAAHTMPTRFGGHLPLLLPQLCPGMHPPNL